MIMFSDILFTTTGSFHFFSPLKLNLKIIEASEPTKNTIYPIKKRVFNCKIYKFDSSAATNLIWFVALKQKKRKTRFENQRHQRRRKRNVDGKENKVK